MMYIGFSTICGFRQPLWVLLCIPRGSGGLLCYFNFISPWPKLDVPLPRESSEVSYLLATTGEVIRKGNTELSGALRAGLAVHGPVCSGGGSGAVLGGMAGSGPRPDVSGSGQTDESRK